MSRLEEIALRVSISSGAPVRLPLQDADWLLAEVVRLTEERERLADALRERTILLDRLALCLGLEAVEDCFVGTDSYEPYVSLVDSIAAVNKEARAVLAEIGATPATYE